MCSIEIGNESSMDAESSSGLITEEPEEEVRYFHDDYAMSDDDDRELCMLSLAEMRNFQGSDGDDSESDSGISSAHLTSVKPDVEKPAASIPQIKESLIVKERANVGEIGKASGSTQDPRHTDGTSDPWRSHGRSSPHLMSQGEAKLLSWLTTLTATESLKPESKSLAEEIMEMNKAIEYERIDIAELFRKKEFAFDICTPETPISKVSEESPQAPRWRKPRRDCSRATASQRGPDAAHDFECEIDNVHESETLDFVHAAHKSIEKCQKQGVETDIVFEKAVLEMNMSELQNTVGHGGDMLGTKVDGFRTCGMNGDHGIV